MSWRLRATYLAYTGFDRAMRAVPGPAADLVAWAAGRTMSYVSQRKRSLLARNMRRVLGPGTSPEVIEEYVRMSFDSYARYWVESARLAGVSSAELARIFSIEGYEMIVEAEKAGKGVILALPHLGNWEYAGRWLAEQGHDVFAVAEVVEPPELFEWFLEKRTRMGLQIIPLREGTSTAVLRALADGSIVCLLADRDLGKNGIEVEFFGEVTTLPPGPAMLALRSGAALFTCGMYHYRGDRYYAIVNPPLDCTRSGSLRADVARITEKIARDLEVLIRRAPEQWHMFVPNWPSDRPAAERT